MLSGVQTKVLSKRPVIISLHAGIQQLVIQAKSFILRAIVFCCGTVRSVHSVRARSFAGGFSVFGTRHKLKVPETLICV